MKIEASTEELPSNGNIFVNFMSPRRVETFAPWIILAAKKKR